MSPFLRNPGPSTQRSRELAGASGHRLQILISEYSVVLGPFRS